MIAAGSGHSIFIIITAAVAGVMLIVGIATAIFRGSTFGKYLIILAVLFAAGIMNANSYNDKIAFANEAEGATCYVYGKIYDIKEGTTYNQLWIKVSTISSDDGALYYDGSTKLISYTTASVDTYYLGQTVVIHGEISRPDLPTNPGEFNSRSYYQNKGIFMIMWSGEVELVESGKATLANCLRNIRNRVMEVYDEVFTETESSIVKAMLLGVKENMDKDTKRLYQLNGIAHVLAISGVHIAIIGMWLYKRLRSLTGSYWVSGALAIALVVLYGIMTGLASSTARAVAMLAITLVGKALGRSADMRTSAGITCVIMAFVNPFIVLDAGFQLSFMAVMGLAIVNPILVDVFGKGGKLRQAIFVSLSATVGTLPIIIYNYYQFPLYSIVLNLVVVPLVSAIIFFSLIVGMVGLVNISVAVYFAYPVKAILWLYEFLCLRFEQLPYYNINTGYITVMQVAAYYTFVGLVLFVLYRYRRLAMKIMAFAMLAAGVFVGYASLDHEFKVVFLDVGQGDGCLVKTASGTNILIDGGSSSNSSLGEYVLMPAIKYYGMAELDYVFLSHGDSDHTSGVEYLLEALHTGITIKNVVVPLYGDMDAFEDIFALVESYGANIIYIDAGESFSDADGFELTCLFPASYTTYTDANNSSMIFRLAYEGYTYLFTGDAGTEEEEAELLAAGIDISADVLKVGHHGSKYSSGDDFLANVSASVAVISVGTNTYGHPTQDAMDRIEASGATIARTDIKGAIITTIAAAGLEITGFVE